MLRRIVCKTRKTKCLTIILHRPLVKIEDRPHAFSSKLYALVKNGRVIN